MKVKILPLLLTIVTFSCQENILSPEIETISDAGSISDSLDQAIILSEAEIISLQFMREEEKLARDVYLVFYEQFGLQAFKNIAESEQKHTDAVKNLLDTFDVEDPVSSDEIGAFRNEDLKAVYLQLIELGAGALEDALAVGAYIEELDILDLRAASDSLTNAKVIEVYSSLEKGSRNHLRSFYGLLIDRGVNYQPQLMEEADFRAIVNSSRESGK